MNRLPKVARQDPALGISGLFRPQAAKRIRERLDFKQSFGGMEFEWRAPEAPGIPEQTLLLTILALAAEQGRQVATRPTSNMGKILRQGLACSGDIFEGNTASVLTSLSNLVLACGYKDAGGTNLQQIKAMLKRLAEITIWVRVEGLEASTRLLSMVIVDMGQTRIALNKRLAAAVWEERYVEISLEERHTLSSQCSKALHAFLSSSLHAGKQWRYKLRSLEKAVWGNSVAGSTQRGRFKKLREALDEIDGLSSWSVQEKKEVFTIFRLKAPAENPSRHSNNKAPA